MLVPRQMSGKSFPVAIKFSPPRKIFLDDEGSLVPPERRDTVAASFINAPGKDLPDICRTHEQGNK